MANEVRLIDANALISYFSGGEAMKTMTQSIYEAMFVKALQEAPTVEAIPVKDLERILSTTSGLELWDYQKRGIMSAVNRLCGKEKNDG